MKKADALKRIANGKGYSEDDEDVKRQVLASPGDGHIHYELAYKVLQIETGHRRPSLPGDADMWGEED